MTIEVVLIIIGLCLAACYVVFEYQNAATPPYQEPVKETPEPEDTLEPTVLNPQAAWPFPRGPNP